MKPIIVDMKDMSDSIEVYESKPNPIFIYFIYLVLTILLIALGWMYFSKIEIVVKGDGIFRSEEGAFDVSSSSSGVVAECNISEGQYVEEGDVLFTIAADSLKETISDYEELLKDTEQRIEMLRAYDSCLKEEKDIPEFYKENKYYEEFIDRQQLLELSVQGVDTEINTQKSQYQKELDNISQQISQYEGQIAKLKQAEECVKSRNSNFATEESYYESIVTSYISSYSLSESQYDSQIEEYEQQKKSLKKQLEQSEEGTKKTLKQEIKKIEDSISQLQGEKEATLNNLELQQIATLEQQIETVNASLNSIKSNESSLQAQLEGLKNSENTNSEKVNRLTEQQNVASEILSYEAKKTEYENALEQYDLESGNARVVAETAGYIYLNQEMYVGSYITQGSTVCRILSEGSNEYYAEVYVDNADIAKLREGQDVKFEIAAYPSSEYGYFTGEVESISKDIKVNQTSGSAYYLVKVKCNNSTLTNKKGQTGNIMNGMACQARVVVDEEKVLTYLLKKIDMLD